MKTNWYAEGELKFEKVNALVEEATWPEALEMLLAVKPPGPGSWSEFFRKIYPKCPSHVVAFYMSRELASGFANKDHGPSFEFLSYTFCVVFDYKSILGVSYFTNDDLSYIWETLSPVFNEAEELSYNLVFSLVQIAKKISQINPFLENTPNYKRFNRIYR